jgi:hypothetical protein
MDRPRQPGRDGVITAVWEPKETGLGEDPPPGPRQIEPHPVDEKNLSRILSHLTAELGGQHWTQDLARTQSVVYLSTSGPGGRHFVGITEDFLRRYQSKDVVAAVAGRGLIEQLRKVMGGRRVLVTKGGLRAIPLDAPDEPPRRPRRLGGRPPGRRRTHRAPRRGPATSGS